MIFAVYDEAELGLHIQSKHECIDICLRNLTSFCVRPGPPTWAAQLFSVHIDFDQAVEYGGGFESKPAREESPPPWESIAVSTGWAGYCQGLRDLPLAWGELLHQSPIAEFPAFHEAAVAHQALGVE